MRETYQPPTPQPALSMTTLTPVIPAPTHVMTAPVYVIPAKAGIHPAASTLPKRRHSSRRLQNSTKPDRILRDSTETRARTRARQPALHLLSLGMDPS